jgi:hypothetical protein
MEDTTTSISHEVTGLVREYEVLVGETRAECGSANLAHLCRLLESDAHWTPDGAEHLVAVARRYGSFFLRNALALAFALGIEDGHMRL